MPGGCAARPATGRLRCDDAFLGFRTEEARRNADQTPGLEAELIAQVGQITRWLQAVLDHVAFEVIEARRVDHL
jgi:hypothetical protein